MCQYYHKPTADINSFNPPNNSTFIILISEMKKLKLRILNYLPEVMQKTNGSDVMVAGATLRSYTFWPLTSHVIWYTCHLYNSEAQPYNTNFSGRIMVIEALS